MSREFLSILDRRFKYTSASKTDIRKTFARIKREQEDKRDIQRRIVEKEIRRVA
mgnify:CR=1 FL=1